MEQRFENSIGNKGSKIPHSHRCIIGEKIDMIDDWIEKIGDGNKVMETLHEEIDRLKDQA